MLSLMNIHSLRGNLRVLSAALGAGVVVTMGALTVAHPATDTSTASPKNLPVATSTVPTEAPAALETPFATPTFKAVPCAKRATMPCN